MQAAEGSKRMVTAPIDRADALFAAEHPSVFAEALLRVMAWHVRRDPIDEAPRGRPVVSGDPMRSAQSI